MADLRPFRALYYNPGKIADISSVVTQPYDKISPEMQSAYYDRSPYNLVRIIRRRSAGGASPEDSYAGAAEDFQKWIRDRILIPESEPAFYPYYQTYEIPGQPGAKKERRGFIGLCRLEEYTARVVHRHEETLSGPKADRMELLKKTRAHFGQVFFLYSDPEGIVESAFAPLTAERPWEEASDEFGTRHSVWRVTDSSAINRMISAMGDKKLVIADGHHRYETALAYRNLCRASSKGENRCDYVMATFIRMETDGLTILPTHRVIHGVPAFDWSRFATDAKNAFDWQDADPATAMPRLQETLAELGRERPAFAAYGGKDRLAILRLKREFSLSDALPGLTDAQRHLDVIILHRLVLERALGIDPKAVREEKNIRYVRALAEAVDEIDSRRAQVCFLLNPTPIESVRDIALAGAVMPQKSTDFYPKLLSGLTMYWLDSPTGEPLK